MKECSAACALALLGLSPDPGPKFVEVQRDTVEIVARVSNQLRNFWDCFRYANLPNFLAEKVEERSAGAAAATAGASAAAASASAATAGASAATAAPTANATAEFLALPAGEIPQGLQMFAVVPLPECPHLDAVREVPASGINVNDPCLKCGNVGENWVCLTCFQVIS